MKRAKGVRCSRSDDESIDQRYWRTKEQCLRCLPFRREKLPHRDWHGRCSHSRDPADKSRIYWLLFLHVYLHYFSLSLQSVDQWWRQTKDAGVLPREINHLGTMIVLTPRTLTTNHGIWGARTHLFALFFTSHTKQEPQVTKQINTYELWYQPVQKGHHLHPLLIVNYCVRHVGMSTIFYLVKMHLHLQERFVETIERDWHAPLRQTTLLGSWFYRHYH